MLRDVAARVSHDDHYATVQHVCVEEGQSDELSKIRPVGLLDAFLTHENLLLANQRHEVRFGLVKFDSLLVQNRRRPIPPQMERLHLNSAQLGPIQREHLVVEGVRETTLLIFLVFKELLLGRATQLEAVEAQLVDVQVMHRRVVRVDLHALHNLLFVDVVEDERVFACGPSVLVYENNEAHAFVDIDVGFEAEANVRLFMVVLIVGQLFELEQFQFAAGHHDLHLLLVVDQRLLASQLLLL